MLRIVSSSSPQVLHVNCKTKHSGNFLSTSLMKARIQRGKGENRRILYHKKLSKKQNISYALTHQPPNGVMPYRRQNTTSTGRTDSILYPKEIVEHLNRYVVGQQAAKKSLAVAVYQHYRRVENNQRVSEEWLLQEVVSAAKEMKKQKKIDTFEDEFSPKYIKKTQRQILKDLEKREDILLEKSNMILLGASGTGKTFMTQKLADILDVPIVICDCTTLTQAGYVGDDVDTVIQKLLSMAAGDIEKCQKGIVFLDEFDKIYTSSDPLHTAGNRDVSGKGVQQALLKLVEGTMVKVRDPLAPNSKVAIDTTNILFIASGAFSNIEHVIARRMDKRSLGFSSASFSGSENEHTTEKLLDDNEEVVSKARDEMLKHCDQGDLISFGMIPELVGRFPVVVPFHCLNKDHLVSVLTEPKGSLIAQTKKFFEIETVELRFSPNAIDAIAEMAVKRKTGARALKSIVEKSVLNAKYEIPGSDVKCVEINEHNLKDNSFTVVEKKNENHKENDREE